VTVNALNVADAALPSSPFGPGGGGAEPSRAPDRPAAKLVMVGLLSWFYRRRPAALLIPAAVLRWC
jgi:hypothetical protein